MKNPLKTFSVLKVLCLFFGNNFVKALVPAAYGLPGLVILKYFFVKVPGLFSLVKNREPYQTEYISAE